MRRLAKCAPFLGLFGGRYSLWLASDHLLHITNTGYTERVRRFYLGDIESISLVRTRAGTVLLVLSLVFLAAFGATYAFWPTHVPYFVSVFVWPLMALSAFAAARALLFGPTSACVLHTAVQEEPLKALGRHRRALKVLQELAPAIVAAQGGPMLPEELSADGPLQALEPARHRAVPGAAAEEAPRPPLRTVGWHLAAFGLAVVLGVSYVADAFMTHPWKNRADTALIAGIVLFSVVALFFQSRAAAVAWLKEALVALLLYVVMLVILISQLLMLFSGNPWTPAASWGPAGGVWFQTTVVVSGLFGVLLGVVGLMLVQDHVAWVRKEQAVRAGGQTPPAAGAGPAGADDDDTAQ